MSKSVANPLSDKDSRPAAHEAQTQYRKMAIEASDWKPEDGIEPLDRRGDQWEASRHNTLQAMTVDEQAVFRTISTATTTRDVDSETKKATASANSKPSATTSPSARRLTEGPGCVCPAAVLTAG